MELLALAAIILMSFMGWVLARECLGKWIDRESRFYFAPAVGMAACGIIAYVASSTRQTWLIPLAVLLTLVWHLIGKRIPSRLDPPPALALFTLIVLLCLYGMEIYLFQLFKTIYSAPDEVWNLYYASGIPPPDQMFAWHQAMFADLHRHYPQDPFLGAMDLYDRPHLGGYITLFFFKLFHLPLAEDHYVYPAIPLRFYHCFWWALNNLYLLGIAPLFGRLLGYRAAIIAVTSTAVTGIVFLSSLGGWVRFAAFYPLVLAFVLFLNGKGPVLQAGLCATSYYLHGSVLPFLLGFGVFQLLCVSYPIRTTLVRLRDVVLFGILGITTVGMWFVVVRWMGSKQPLFYYYLYGAGLTQAQTEPVASIAKAFYAKYSWAGLSLFPLRSLFDSIWPVYFFRFVLNLLSGKAIWQISELAATMFCSQRFWVLAATGLTATPVVVAGLLNLLTKQYAGRTILALYLIPTLLVALLYRIEWTFSLHIMGAYHALILFCWVYTLKNARTIYLTAALLVITIEGVICVLFADFRFNPVHGIRFEQVTSGNWIYLVGYLILLLVILSAGVFELSRNPVETGSKVISEPAMIFPKRWPVVGKKVLVGFAIVAVTIASHSLFCLQFY